MDLKKIIFLFFSFLHPFLHSQDFYSGSWISTDIHYGFLIPHNSNMQYMINGHTPGAEINFYKTTCRKKWQCTYRDPEVGLSAFYIYMNNSQEMGYGLSITPYVNFPLIKKKRFELKLRTSESVGYLSKKFDAVTNFKNGAIGSHINTYVHLRLNAHYSLSENFRLEYGLGFSHFSNGAFKMPNLGYNIPTLNLGFGYRVSDKPKIISYDSLYAEKDKPRWEVVCFAGGFKAEVEPPIGRKFAAYSISPSLDWVRTEKQRMLIGIEMAYYGGNYYNALSDSVIINKKSDLLQEGIRIGYAVRVGSLEFPYEAGYYFHSPVKGSLKFFDRIGLRYYCGKHLMINFTLKTHLAVAQYWEVGAGYIFRKNEKKSKK